MFFRYSYLEAYLCPNIINFDPVDFSERCPEEVMFLLTLSVHVHRDILLLGIITLQHVIQNNCRWV